MISLMLDLANILGGFLLAISLLARLPKVGDDLARFAGRLEPFGWIVGVGALVAGGYFAIRHLFDGPGLLHFEVVGFATGILLLRGLVGRRSDPTTPDGQVSLGIPLLIAVFGVIAILVGLEGLFTPD